ncbi:MAG TPA: DUF177 domain-containing protein [Haliangiales bacterium]|nr:DUF177 domain-containing protein [Haliangiales bacterium]
MALQGTEADLDTAELETELRLDKQQRDVYVHGSLTGAVTLLCSRCLGPARVPVAAKIAVLYAPRGRETDEEVDALGEPDPTAPDLLPYDDEIVDLGEMLREETLLALPMAPLCNEACKGLCPSCGKDWNQGPCDCVPVTIDDRWAALKSVKIKES